MKSASHLQMNEHVVGIDYVQNESLECGSDGLTDDASESSMTVVFVKLCKGLPSLEKFRVVLRQFEWFKAFINVYSGSIFTLNQFHA